MVLNNEEKRLGGDKFAKTNNWECKFMENSALTRNHLLLQNSERGFGSKGSTV